MSSLWVLFYLALSSSCQYYTSSLSINSYATWFNVLQIESTIPQVISETIELDEKATRYQWSTEGDYPPHLTSIPKQDQFSQWTIFNKLGLLSTMTLLPKIVPKKKFLGSFSEKLNEWIHGTAYEGHTIDQIEDANKSNRKTSTDVMRGQDIGLLPDWWSDARFAQQQFTGTNPTTIKLASSEWIEAFKNAATSQGRKDAASQIANANTKELYIQDYSYFREAVKAGKDDELLTTDPEMEITRFACAAVSLFQLHSDGKLHPLAIVIDWKGTMEKSVTVFNKRTRPADPYYAPPSAEEKSDWPWRYAKTCAQVSDWINHEMAIHLVNTHLVEEVIIVAANRAFPSEHLVYRLLEPHWFRTLSLNAAARATLVPNIIIDLVGFDVVQSKAFINHAFDHFDFTGKYIPNDLPSRGFPLEDLDKARFKN